MIEILVVALCCWLGFKVLMLAFRMAWSLTKMIATVLLVLAFPALIGCLLFAGGVLLAIPLLLIAIAFGLLKACVWPAPPLRRFAVPPNVPTGHWEVFLLILKI